MDNAKLDETVVMLVVVANSPDCTTADLFREQFVAGLHKFEIAESLHEPYPKFAHAYRHQWLLIYAHRQEGVEQLRSLFSGGEWAEPVDDQAIWNDWGVDRDGTTGTTWANIWPGVCSVREARACDPKPNWRQPGHSVSVSEQGEITFVHDPDQDPGSELN